MTPKQLANWKDKTEDMDMDLVDGYEELDEETQQKVHRALDLGHVDDEDWKGVRVFHTV